jgi:hypothetical protein
MPENEVPDIALPGDGTAETVEETTETSEETTEEETKEVEVEHDPEDKELLDSLKIDEDEKEEKKEEKKETEDEDENLKDLPYHRTGFKAIKEAYPEFFKKFPDLKEAFFREREFTKEFPTIEEARDAKARSTFYSGIEENLLSGDATPLLTAIKEADSSAAKKLASSVLGNLYAVDPELFFSATTPYMNNVINAMHQHGLDTQNKNVQYAALYLSQFVTGKLELPKGEEVKQTQERDPEKIKFDQEKNQFMNERYKVAFSEVVGRLDKIIDKEIGSNLDPDGVFSPHMTKLITKAIKDDLHKALGSDPRHTGTLNQLWKKYSRTGFQSEEIKTQILRAVLSRAKPLIPQIRNRHRSEALETKTSSDEKKVVKIRPNEIQSSGRSATPGKIPSNPKEIDWSKTSDADILNGKFVPKR